MRLMKSIGVGVVAAAGATILALMVSMVAGSTYIWTQMNGASGGIGAYTSGLELPLLAGLAGGVAGFVWQWRRGRRPAPA
jgi:hypothetical protein